MENVGRDLVNAGIGALIGVALGVGGLSVWFSPWIAIPVGGIGGAYLGATTGLVLGDKYL